MDVRGTGIVVAGPVRIGVVDDEDADAPYARVSGSGAPGPWTSRCTCTLMKSRSDTRLIPLLGSGSSHGADARPGGVRGS
ncbi:hypothetical protein ACE1SV_01610 [Streptomyces sp. E-15]